MIVFFLLSLSCLSLRGLIVHIAEAAAALVGALTECAQELHRKTSRLCTAVHTVFTTRVLNR